MEFHIAAVIQDGAGAGFAPVDGEFQAAGGDFAFIAFVVDGEGSICVLELQHVAQLWLVMGDVVDMVPFMDGLGDGGRFVIQKYFRCAGVGAVGTVQLVVDAAPQWGVACGLQCFSQALEFPVFDDVPVFQLAVRGGFFSVDGDFLPQVLFSAIDVDGVFLPAGHQVSQVDFRGETILARDDGNMAAVPYDAVQAGFLPVQGNLGQAAHGAGEGFALSPQAYHEAQARAPVVFFQADACIQQGVGDGEVTEVKEAVFHVIDMDGEEMQGVEGGNLQNAQRGYRIGFLELLGQALYVHYLVRMADGHPAEGHIQCLCHVFLQMGGKGTAAHQHHCLGGIGVELDNLLDDGIGQVFHIGQDGLDDLIRSKAVFHAQDVRESDVFSLGGLPFDFFCHIEVQQEFLGNGLGDFITGQGYHAVGGDGAVLGDGHVGGACADIHQHQVQMAHGGRNKHVDGGDRLQGQGPHFQGNGVQG